LADAIRQPVHIGYFGHARAAATPQNATTDSGRTKCRNSFFMILNSKRLLILLKASSLFSSFLFGLAGRYYQGTRA